MRLVWTKGHYEYAISPVAIRVGNKGQRAETCPATGLALVGRTSSFRSAGPKTAHLHRNLPLPGYRGSCTHKMRVSASPPAVTPPLGSGSHMADLALCTNGRRGMNQPPPCRSGLNVSFEQTRSRLPIRLPTHLDLSGCRVQPLVGMQRVHHRSDLPDAS